ncbi:MAG: VOC family protein [Phycisphaerales bacterium]
MKKQPFVTVCQLLLLASSAAAHPIESCCSAPPSDATHEAQPVVVSVDGIGITVRDLDTSLKFYQTVLGCELVSQREELGDGIEHLTGVFGVRSRTAVLRLGSEIVELTDYLAPEGKAIDAEARSNDRSFQHIAIVVSDMGAAYQQLRRHNVQHISPGPQTLPNWNPNAGGIKAFYFKDPDGHPLELIWFPDGKGDPKWKVLAKERPNNLFLGIDHTAIVVRDTDRSLAFYRDTLGMKVAGTSENYGIEQERLNNVFGAHLRITGLRASKGIGIEFLEYITPSTGRDAPPTAAANDLSHYHSIVTTSSLSAAAVTFDMLRQQTQQMMTAPAWVSSVAVDPDGAGEQPLQRMARDADGHALLIRETSTSSNSAATTSDRK